MYKPTRVASTIIQRSFKETGWMSQVELHTHSLFFKFLWARASFFPLRNTHVNRWDMEKILFRREGTARDSNPRLAEAKRNPHHCTEGFSNIVNSGVGYVTWVGHDMALPFYEINSCVCSPYSPTETESCTCRKWAQLYSYTSIGKDVIQPAATTVMGRPPHLFPITIPSERDHPSFHTESHT